MFHDTAHVDPPLLSGDAPAEEPPSRGSHAAGVHREFRQDEFWRGIPAYAGVSRSEFEDHRFQQRQTVTNARQLRETLGGLVPESFYEDLAAGLKHAPMALRVSPYLLSLIDWSEPLHDPIRTQFLPLHGAAGAGSPAC